MNKNKYFLLISFLLLTGCSINSDPNSSFDSPLSTANGGSSSVVSTPISSNSDQNTITIEDLFDINNPVTFDIDISNNELQKLQSDYIAYNQKGLKSPIYRRADMVTITVIKNQKEYVFQYPDVGVRMKGNTSRQKFINEKNEIYANIHLKLSFEETFDNPLYYQPNEIMTWNSEERLAREERKFLDMSKIDLRFNKNYDKTWIREYYSLAMFRDLGIMTQRSNFSKVVLHQDGNKAVNYGVYLMTEALNKSFIKHALEGSDNYINMSSWSQEKQGSFGVAGSKYGQLYKASYGINCENSGSGADMSHSDDYLFGVEPDDASYTPIYELKTNKNGNGDHSQIKHAFQVLQNGTEQDIGEVIDLEYFAMYEAIATILGNPDDLRNNYNNYALYFRRTDGKMIIIPIDEDRVLGISKDWDPSGNAMSLVGPFESKAVGNGNSQHNPLYLKTILNPQSATYQLYCQNLKTILDSKWVSEDYFNKIYSIVKSHYEAFSNSSLTAYPWTLEGEQQGTNENMCFKSYIDKKKNVILKALEGGTIDPNPGDSPIKSYENFYLRYTDNWSRMDDENKFQRVDTDEYRYTHLIVEKDLLDFQCKIFTNDGGFDLWLMTDSSGGVLKEGGNIIFSFSSADVGKNLTFSISVSKGTLTWWIG